MEKENKKETEIQRNDWWHRWVKREQRLDLHRLTVMISIIVFLFRFFLFWKYRLWLFKYLKYPKILVWCLSKVWHSNTVWFATRITTIRSDSHEKEVCLRRSNGINFFWKIMFGDHVLFIMFGWKTFMLLHHWTQSVHWQICLCLTMKIQYIREHFWVILCLIFVHFPVITLTWLLWVEKIITPQGKFSSSSGAFDPITWSSSPNN